MDSGLSVVSFLISGAFLAPGPGGGTGVTFRAGGLSMEMDFHLHR